MPGFGGSSLYLPRAVEPRLWIDYPRLLAGGVSLLQLDAAGTGPGPLTSGEVLSVGGPIDTYYGQLTAYLESFGHAVAGYGWDWRMSIVAAGDGLSAYIRATYDPAGVCLVAHSAGGLVARLALADLDARGKLALVSRVIYLGCPHYGTWLPVDTLTRRNPLYQTIAFATRTARDRVPPRSAAVDQTMCSFVSLYELLPFRDYGPYHDADPASVAALYQASTWSPIGQTVLQARLDGAVATQALLRTAGYQSLSASIYRDDRDTPSGYVSGIDGEPVYACTLSPDGDDTVERVSSVSQWTLRTSYVRSGHQDMPINSGVFKAVVNSLPQ